MGFGNVSNVKFVPQIDEELFKELHKMVKVAILEDFTPNYYADPDEVALSALKAHKLFFEKYPEEYKELFRSSELIDLYLDAHIIVAAMFLLKTDMDINEVIKSLRRIQINRFFMFFENINIADRLIDANYEKKVLREIIYEYLRRLEAEKGKDYCTFYSVKYRKKLQNLFASLRIKRSKLSDLWKECMDYIFINKTKRKEWTYQIFKEIMEMRSKKTITSLKNAKKVPYSVIIGHAWKILKKKGKTEEEIKEFLLNRTDLMSNTEVKRSLRQLEETGKLENVEVKEKIKERIKKAPTDIFELLTALFVLDNEAKELTIEAIENDTKKLVEKLKEKIQKQDIGIGIDISGNTVGYETDYFTLRRTFDKNILIGYILSQLSSIKDVLLFNERSIFINLDEDIKDILEEVIDFQPEGGSAPYYALERLIEHDPDMIIMISDFNENYPIRGILAAKLSTLARQYKKPIILLQTEYDISNITELINIMTEEHLTNVYILPIKKAEQLRQIAETLELEEKIKKVIEKIMRKRKDIEVFA